MIEIDNAFATERDAMTKRPRRLDPAAIHHELVRTEGEVRVDDELGMGDNLH